MSAADGPAGQQMVFNLSRCFPSLCHFFKKCFLLLLCSGLRRGRFEILLASALTDVCRTQGSTALLYSAQLASGF